MNDISVTYTFLEEECLFFKSTQFIAPKVRKELINRYLRHINIRNQIDSIVDMIIIVVDQIDEPMIFDITVEV